MPLPVTPLEREIRRGVPFLQWHGARATQPEQCKCCDRNHQFHTNTTERTTARCDPQGIYAWLAGGGWSVLAIGFTGLVQSDQFGISFHQTLLLLLRRK